MFIRVVKKQNSKAGKIFHQFMLAQNSRVKGKVKQSNILSLGSDIELLDSKIRSEVLEILKSKIFNQALLFPIDNNVSNELANKYFEKFIVKFGHQEDYTEKVSTPPKHDGSDYQEIDVASVDVGDGMTTLTTVTM